VNIIGTSLGFVDLGSGQDNLNIGNGISTDDSVSQLILQNVESITTRDIEERGGRIQDADQTIALAGPVLPAPVQVDPGGGIDKLDLTAYAGAVDVKDGMVEIIVGGGNDNVFDMGSVAGLTDLQRFTPFYDTDPRVDGGGGFDTVSLQTPTENALSPIVANVECVTGGSTADHLVILSAPHGTLHRPRRWRGHVLVLQGQRRG
jgi:hypothetical protein